LNCEYYNITLARNKAPWWWSDKIETCRSVLKCFKRFYMKLYVHSLVDKLKWFYENARCYNKIYSMCINLETNRKSKLCEKIWQLDLILHCCHIRLEVGKRREKETLAQPMLMEFNNCPTRCVLFSFSHFCGQLYMFRVSTPETCRAAYRNVKNWISCILLDSYKTRFTMHGPMYIKSMLMALRSVCSAVQYVTNFWDSLSNIEQKRDGTVFVN